MESKKLLWMSWKGINHISAGGAEVVKHKICSHLYQLGWDVTVITSATEEKLDKKILPYKEIKLGNRFTVYICTLFYYFFCLRKKNSYLIDECNTLPFFSAIYGKEKKFLFIHQMAKEVWLKELPFYGYLGYFLEPYYLKLFKNRRVITVSESTKKDLFSIGFNPNKISIIRNICDYERGTYKKRPSYRRLLYVGSLRRMKQPEDLIYAMKCVSLFMPDLELQIYGYATYTRRIELQNIIDDLNLSSSIKINGPLSEDDKFDVMRESDFLLVPSVKEGWGLVVTEAGSQGTPSIAYNVSGLRDSIIDNKTGFLTKPSSAEMAKKIIEAYSSEKDYMDMSKSSIEFSREFISANTANDFLNVINNAD